MSLVSELNTSLVSSLAGSSFVASTDVSVTSGLGVSTISLWDSWGGTTLGWSTVEDDSLAIGVSSVSFLVSVAVVSSFVSSLVSLPFEAAAAAAAALSLIFLLNSSAAEIPAGLFSVAGVALEEGVLSFSLETVVALAGWGDATGVDDAVFLFFSSKSTGLPSLVVNLILGVGGVEICCGWTVGTTGDATWPGYCWPGVAGIPPYWSGRPYTGW